MTLQVLAAAPVPQHEDIRVQAQYAPLREEVLAAITRVCDSQQFILGAETEALEATTARMLGVKHALAVSSGTDALRLSLPWLIDHIEETRRVLGPDFFTYGLEANRKTIAALAQYLHEQGLAPRVVAPEELFVPGIG